MRREENVPRGVLGLPHERTSGVTDAVCAEHDRVRSHPLRVSGCDASEPRQSNDEARSSDTYFKRISQ